MVSVLGYYELPVTAIQLPQMIQTKKVWLEPEQIPAFIEAIREEPFAIPALPALRFKG